MSKRRVSAAKRHRNQLVSEKISRLRHEENVPERQAIAMAINMGRAHRLRPGGGYKRVKRGRG